MNKSLQGWLTFAIIVVGMGIVGHLETLPY